MLKELASSMELGEVELVSRMSSSSAKHEISDFAASREVDLIVMSSHARRGVFSLLGSTAAGVVHAAPCDVMVIRARE